ncbi:hypothetical protein K5549_014827 [Capra hircus]|nr:hypothetical protein K5549_014827 [Capra hircus]
MASGCKIGPSIHNSDLASLGMLDSEADYLHLDVINGYFVPNITFGPPVAESLQKQLGQDPSFDVHMMVSRPEEWVKPMAAAGASQHLEAFIWRNQQLQIDTALVMTVKHGLVGQKLMKDMTRKVHWLRTQFPSLDTEVDGGVGPDTIHKCAEAGANTIVSGSAIMKSEDPRSMINLLRTVCSDEESKRKWDRDQAGTCEAIPGIKVFQCLRSLVCRKTAFSLIDLP